MMFLTIDRLECFCAERGGESAAALFFRGLLQATSAGVAGIAVFIWVLCSTASAASPGFHAVFGGAELREPQSVQMPLPTSIVVFGDSLSDQGNARPYLESYNEQVYNNGRFTDGLTAVEVMAEELGLTLRASGHLSLLDLTHAGSADSLNQGAPQADEFNHFVLEGAGLGNNFAVATAMAAGFRIYDVPQQIQSYLLANGNRASPDTLFVYMAGSNDVMDIAVGLPWPSTIDRVMLDASRIYQQLESLVAVGARHFLIVDVPNVSRTPALISLPAIARWQIWWINNLYNRRLMHWGEQLQAEYAHIQVNFFSAYTWMAHLIDHPDLYGLTNVTNACYFYGATDWNSPCSASTVHHYAFIDSIHPTATVHTQFGLALAASVKRAYRGHQ